MRVVIIGGAVRLGEAAGVPTPLNVAISAALKPFAAGQLGGTCHLDVIRRLDVACQPIRARLLRPPRGPVASLRLPKPARRGTAVATPRILPVARRRPHAL